MEAVVATGEEEKKKGKKKKKRGLVAVVDLSGTRRSTQHLLLHRLDEHFAFWEISEEGKEANNLGSKTNKSVVAL